MLQKKTCILFVLVTLPMQGVVGQDGWSVTYTPERICALKGSTVNMSCTYSYPSGNIVTQTFWYFNDDQDLTEYSEYRGRVEYLGDMKHESTLRLNDLRESDAKTYYFRLITNKNRYSGREGGCTVQVTDLQVSVDPDTVTEGQSVTFTCNTACSLTGSPAFIWYKNNQRLSFTSQEHQITASSGDAGSYSCAVRGYENLLSPAVTLSVEYPPKNTSVSVSPSGEIEEGSSVTLTCSSDANPPVHSYTWFKKNEAVTSERGTGESYTITNISSEDSGQYYCEAQNQHGALNSTAVTVDVHYSPKKPSVSVSPSGEIEEGSSVTLTCSSDANPPVHRYTWFKKTGAVTSERGTGESYTITNISSEDSGQFYCEAQNQHGALNSTAVTVDVQYAPKHTSVSVSPSGEIEEGSSVTLTCSSDANPPVQNYTWFKKSGAVTSERGTGKSYTITNISSEASGQYYCEAQNQHGSHNATSQLIMKKATPSGNQVWIVSAIVGTAAIVALVFPAVIVCKRWRNPVKEAESRDEDNEDNKSPVYDDISGMALSHTAAQDTNRDEDEAALYSTVETANSSSQEETLYSNIQKSHPKSEDEVQYASIMFSKPNAAPRPSAPKAEDDSVVYSEVAIHKS